NCMKSIGIVRLVMIVLEGEHQLPRLSSITSPQMKNSINGLLKNSIKNKTNYRIKINLQSKIFFT
ncbi:MAG: hypothetical protein QXV60_04480, partial [Nitrososphaerota archaeon]